MRQRSIVKKLKRQIKSKPRRHLKGRTMKIGGIPVVNAKTPIALDITLQDIKKGQPKDPFNCAAAMAAKRQIPGCTNAEVHSRVLYVRRTVGGKEVIERYATPDALRHEALVFDRGGVMEPDLYELRPVSQRFGRRQGSNSPGARDLGSTDRTPSFKRRAHYPANVRPTAPNHRNDDR